MPQDVSYPSEFALLYCVQDVPVFMHSLQSAHYGTDISDVKKTFCEEQVFFTASASLT